MANDLGNDIALVLEELTEPIDIYNYEHDILTHGYMDIEHEARTRTPFESTFMIKAVFPFNTTAIIGDLISLTTTTDKYIISSFIDEIFEQGVISKEGFLYRCNVVADINRKGEEQTRDENYELVPSWDSIYTDIDLLFTGQLSDQGIDEEIYARVYSSTRKAFISNQLDIRVNDQLVIGDKKYQIDLMEMHRLPGVKICRLTEDQRE